MFYLYSFQWYCFARLADIKQAFLNVGISEEHIDYLRFLWSDVNDEIKVIAFRFLRAVFGVTSSPFLLNATIKHHLAKFIGTDLRDVIEKILEVLC